MAYDNFLIDKRVVERNIAKGLVNPDELKRHIESLPDRESNCVHVSLDGSSGQDSARADNLDRHDIDDSDDVDSDDVDSDDADSDDADDAEDGDDDEDDVDEADEADGDDESDAPKGESPRED